MKFVTDIDKKKYDTFVKKHEKSHFLQSYAWGEFSYKARNLIPHYVGLEDDKGKLVCVTLLLQKKLPLGYSYFYAPRGYVIDFWDKKLLEEFTNEIVKYAKKRKSIFIKIDPDIIWKEYNYKDEEVELKKNPKEVFNTLKGLGYKHLGFTKNFETMQPRYSFRIDLTQSMEEIESKFNKTNQQRIRKGRELGALVRKGTSDDIDEFNHLMELTESRKDFLSHDLEYYRTLYDIYTRDNDIALYMGSIDCDKVIDDYTKEKESILPEIDRLKNTENLSKSNKTKLKELEQRNEKLDEYINEYQKAKDEFGNIITLASQFVIMYADKAWVLYAGNHNVLTDSCVNYTTYYEQMKYCKENGIKMYDQFGTIGDINSNNPRYGLHIFKKKFGGDYVEFMGEFDLVTNKFMYFIFTKLVPIYRKSVRSITKLKRR